FEATALRPGEVTVTRGTVVSVPAAAPGAAGPEAREYQSAAPIASASAASMAIQIPGGAPRRRSPMPGLGPGPVMAGSGVVTSRLIQAIGWWSGFGSGCAPTG